MYCLQVNGRIAIGQFGVGGCGGVGLAPAQNRELHMLRMCIRAPKAHQSAGAQAGEGIQGSLAMMRTSGDPQRETCSRANAGNVDISLVFWGVRGWRQGVASGK